MNLLFFLSPKTCISRPQGPFTNYVCTQGGQVVRKKCSLLHKMYKLGAYVVKKFLKMQTLFVKSALVDLIITELKNHMTCYKFECSIWQKIYSKKTLGSFHKSCLHFLHFLTMYVPSLHFLCSKLHVFDQNQNRDLENALIFQICNYLIFQKFPYVQFLLVHKM